MFTKTFADLPQCQVITLENADYQTTHAAMLDKTLAKIAHKSAGSPMLDELWLVEHNDVYTLGQAGKEEHILRHTQTPIIKTDRGGQVTWHGKGQLVVYFLFDLQRLGWGVRDLVSHAEQAIEDVLEQYLPADLHAKARKDAPGVYIYSADGSMLGKIASLGFKIKQRHSYHGIAINLCNSLAAFSAINPCGYVGMNMLRLKDFADVDPGAFTAALLTNIAQRRQGQWPLRTV